MKIMQEEKYEYDYEYDLWSTKWLVSSFYVKEKY